MLLTTDSVKNTHDGPANLFEAIETAQTADANSSISFESADSAFASKATPSEMLTGTLAMVNGALEALYSAEGVERTPEMVEADDQSAISAAVAAAYSPEALLKVLGDPKRRAGGPLADNEVVLSTGDDHFNEYSVEAFDNQSLGDFASLTVGLAYTTGRQSKGMEAIFRTVTLTPDQSGYTVEVPLLLAQNNLTHESGAPSKWNYRRILDANIDYKLLQDNVTTLMPSKAGDNAKYFVPGIDVELEDGKRKVTSGFIKTNQTVNLLGLGMIDQAAKSGTPDYHDALDRKIQIKSVLVTAGDNDLAWNVQRIPYNVFQNMPEQGDRQLHLNLPITSLSITKDTKQADGSALEAGALKTLVDTGATVRIRTTLTGNANVQRGEVSVSQSNITLVSIVDEHGVAQDIDDAAFDALRTELGGGLVTGCVYDARVTNSNHRYLGLQLDVRTMRERLTTSLRAPVFIPFPRGEDRNQALLDRLTYAVTTRREQDGLTALIEYHEGVMNLTGGMRGELVEGDFIENMQQMEGIGRWLINPYIAEVDVDLDDAQSLDTATLIANAQETLRNKIRSVWFDIKQKTNLEQAARFIDGGKVTKQFRPVMLSSETVNSFMTVVGDTRALGNGVPFELHGNVDKRLSEVGGTDNPDVDVMYLVVGRDGTGIDPLNAGVMLNTPSLVAKVNAARQNSQISELVVQPIYAHYITNPIIVKFNIKNVNGILERALAYKTFETNGAMEPPAPVTP